MHSLSTCILLIILLIVISAFSASPSKPLVNNGLCPEEYRELRRRQDEETSELDDDDDNSYGESLENICEQAMAMIVRHRNFDKLNPSVLLGYCPHYDERLALARENNNTLCENKKQELDIKQRGQQLKMKQYEDSNNRDDNDDDDDDDKRRALRRRELQKRFALRFIRKRM